MQQIYNGFIVFTKQLEKPAGQFFGYVYCPAIERAFYFNNSRLAVESNVPPRLGTAVEIKEGPTKEGSEFASASTVKLIGSSVTQDELVARVDIIAKLHRLKPAQLRLILVDNSLKIDDWSELAPLSLVQIEAVSKWATSAKKVAKPAQQLLKPSDEQLRFGQVIRSEFDRGFGFVQEQGSGNEAFLHISVIKQEPKVGDLLVYATEQDPSNHRRSRVWWVSHPKQEITWLRGNYTKFSTGGLDVLFELGDEELALEVLNFRIDRNGPLNADKPLRVGIGLLKKVQRLIPNLLPHALNQLVDRAESLDKLLLWTRFGDAENALSYVPTLESMFQEGARHSADGVLTDNAVGLLNLTGKQDRAAALVQAWWPANKIMGLESRELETQLVALFKWMLEINQVHSKENGLSIAESYTEWWRLFDGEVKRYFALHASLGLIGLIHEATGVLLPSIEFFCERSATLTENELEQVVESGTEAGALALSTLLRRLEDTNTKSEFGKLFKWLLLGEVVISAYRQHLNHLINDVTQDTSPVLRLRLWLSGFLPDLDWERVVSLLEEDSAWKIAFVEWPAVVSYALAKSRRRVAHSKPDSLPGRTKSESLRLAATRRLLHLYSQVPTTFEDTAAGLLKGLKAMPSTKPDIRLVNLARITSDSFRADIDELAKELAGERPELAFALWESGLLAEMPGSAVLAKLVGIASTNKWAVLPAYIKQQSPNTLAELLKLLLGVDTEQLLGLPRTILLPWIGGILDSKQSGGAESNKGLMADVLTTERLDIVLPLLAWDLYQADDPATFLRGLNQNERDALLDASNVQFRIAVATFLFDLIDENGNQSSVDKSYLQILARLGIGKLEVDGVSAGPDSYYNSALLGRLQRYKSIWRLGSYEALLRPPLEGEAAKKDAMWGDYPGSRIGSEKVREKLTGNQAAELLQRAMMTCSTWLRHQLWKAEAIEVPVYDQLYEEITWFEDGFARTGDGSAWEPAYQLIQLLSITQRLEFLEWIIENKHTDVFSNWSDKLVRGWLENLPDTEAKQSTWNYMLATVGTPALLSLWLTDLVEYYDFEAYRLLVFTLPPANQILFLRKTFKLLAADRLQLTAIQLNSIVRYSRTELGGGPVLDYSLDLALTVLNALSKDGALPDERGIVEIVCRYIREDTTSLSLIGKVLFAPCLGRSEVEKKRSPSRDVVKGRIGGTEYPASTDKKTVFVDGNELSVINNTVELFGDSLPVSWIVTPSYDYYPSANNIDLKPSAISLCEGRLSYKEDTESKLPFWWCCNRPCYKPNQDGRATEEWQQFTLVDFITILKLPFNADAYYSFVGLINRVNRLLTRLQCRCCNHILRPVGQSDFNFYRANRFKCTNRECEERESEVYLSHCLNGYCMSVIDSRDSKRCSYRTEGRPDRHGMYICANCGGCCSKQALVRRRENLEKTHQPEMLVSHGQYKLIAENLAGKLYHWERMRVFCYQCTKPMQQKHAQANYNCPDCHTEYRLDMVHIEVARRKNLIEEDA